MSIVTRIFVIGAALLFAIPSVSKAGLVLTVDSTTSSSPGTGSLTVSVFNSGPAVVLGGFQYDLSVTDGVNFTAATTGSANYVYATNSAADTYLGGSIDALSLLPASSFTASDSPATGDGTIIDTGATFTLGLISFSVPSGIQGGTSIPVSIANILLFDGELNEITPDGSSDGSISTSLSTPEPGTFVLGAFAVFGTVAMRIRNRRARS